MTRGVMLTHDRKFHLAIRTLRHLAYLDEMIVLVPKGQRRLFQSRTSFPTLGPFPNHEVIEHSVESVTTDGLIRYGALRHHQMDFLLRRLRTGDVGIVIDDDLDKAQGVNIAQLDDFRAEVPRRNALAIERYGRKWNVLGCRAQQELRREFNLVKGSGSISATEIRQRIKAISDLVRYRDPRGYFTFAYTALSSNGLVRRKIPTRWIKWSGILGVLPESRNPFDPSVCGCEDWDAAGRLLCEFGAVLMADPSTAFNMDIDRPKYTAGGPLFDDRVAAIDRLTNRYHYGGLNIFQKGRTAIGRLPSVTCNPRVIQLLQEAA